MNQRPHRGCAAVGCMQIIPAHKFMCEDHSRIIPQANRDELMRTFEDWKLGRALRIRYAAARIRAIVAVAGVENRACPHSLTEILSRLDSGERSVDA